MKNKNDGKLALVRNIDIQAVDGFGEEWERFDHSDLIFRWQHLLCWCAAGLRAEFG